jgi:glycosyltransferase involved in cell wall biosynthesis
MAENLLSIILLSYFSGKKIIQVYDKVSDTLNVNSIPFEFIIIDDGSTDDSFQIAKDLENKFNNVKAYQLSKNYTTAYSIFAGLKLSKGSCAIAIPDDEQQPYSTIVDMYHIWENGEKIIIPHRISRNDGYFTEFSSKIFYGIINKLSNIKYPSGGADLFFIDREIIDIVNNQIRPVNTFIIPELLRLGFTPYFFPYQRPESDRIRSRWSFKKRLRLGLNIFFSSSSFLIKIITFIGLFFSFVSVLLILFYTYIKIFGNANFWGFLPSGWTSLVLLISLFSGLILLSLGIIAEYIWRIYEEVKTRPPYIIKKEK